MIKTAIIGASGYIGRHLWNKYRSAHPNCIGTTFSAAQPDLSFFDVRNPNLSALRLEESEHRAVLIASGRASVAFCERKRDEAYSVNVKGILELIRQIGRTSLQVIFLSSDYVFDGRNAPYDDSDKTWPMTEYGRQKEFVEKEIPSLTSNFLILRLSKIYGIEKGDGTLLDEMACSLAAGQEVLAARDQVFCPTYVADLVRAIDLIQARGLNGVMNVCSPEIWSRHEIALALVEAMQADRAYVRSISLGDIPLMAGRPLDTSMRCSRLTGELQAAFTPLQDSVRQIAAAWETR